MTTHQGSSYDAGSMPVPPDAVRVWRGTRLDRTPAGWPPFVTFLEQTLFPIEATWRPAFGLTAYIAGVKSPDASAMAPDEFALVFYESAAVYDAGLQTPAGSIYPLFPTPAFSGGKSGYPARLQSTLEANLPVYLFDGAVDWYHGSVRCHVLTLQRGQSAEALLAATQACLRSTQAAPPPGLDGMIVMVDSASADAAYLIAWEHWAPGAVPAGDLFAPLAPLTDVAFAHDEAAPMTVTGGLYDRGVTVTPPVVGDQLLRLQFLRRGLAFENGKVVSGPFVSG
jgi:hypothetical protein